MSRDDEKAENGTRGLGPEYVGVSEWEVKYRLDYLTLKMAEKVPGWLERILLPQISEVKGELRAVSGRLDGLEGKMDGEFKAVHSEFRAVRSEIERVEEKVGDLDKRMDVTQRLAVVEEQLRELRAKA